MNIFTLFLLTGAGALLLVFVWAFWPGRLHPGRRTSRSAPNRRASRTSPYGQAESALAQVDRSQIPGSFPVTVRAAFLTRSERRLYGALQDALRDTSCLVFPNVRLNDVFTISASGQERQSVLGRLRDKHVDFLIVDAASLRPVLGIELDGESHDTPQQQYRDQVKDVLFRSAGLSLLRLDAHQPHTAASLSRQLGRHLPRRRKAGG